MIAIGQCAARTAPVSRWSRRLVLILLGVGGFLIGAALAAFAYWTITAVTTGGYAMGQSDRLAAPTSPSATATGSGTISVSWTSPGGQLPGAKYQVTRATGPGAGTVVCTATYSPCQDGGLTAGTTYGYSVVAVLDAWQSAGATASTTTPTPTLAVTISSSPYTAGVPMSVTTIQAKLGATVDTTYSGSKTITWSGLTSSPSGQGPSYPASGVTFTNGSAAPATSFTTYAAAATTLTATDANATGVTGSVSFVVSPAAASRFVVPTPAGPVAGTSFTETVTALDPYQNVATGYSGGSLAFSGPAGAPNGTLPSYPSGPVTFTNGVSTAMTITLYDAQSGPTLTVSDGAISGTSGGFTVAPGAASQLAVPTPPAPQVAGIGFTETVSALDPYKNTATTYVGSKTLTFSGPATAPNGAGPTYPASPVTFTNGVSTVMTITLYDAEATALTVKDSTVGATGTSGTFTVGPASASKLIFATQPGGGSAGAAWSQQPKVAVVDAYSNTSTTSSASVTLAVASQPSSGAVLSCSTNPLAVVSGLATFSGCQIAGTAGSYTLTATSSGLTSATSNVFSITAGAPASITISSGNNQAASANTAFASALSVLVKDGSGNVVPGASVTFAAPANGASATFATGCTSNPQPYSCVVSTNAGGVATSSIPTSGALGSYVVSATTGSLSANFVLANTTGATLTLTPPSGSAGVTVSLASTGTGWSKNATSATATFNNAALSVTSFATSGNGKITAGSFTLPNLPPGAYLVFVKDSGGNAGAAVFNVP
jgi:hypothetical protein